MSSVDSTIVATGLPTLRQALHTRINWVTWTMTAYQLSLVVAMPVTGRISDQLGRKRVFVVAAAVFTSASFLCGLASNIAMLIALRVVQAAGGAAFVPSASGMVVTAFGKDKQRALGMFSSIFPMGALVGPVVGGVIISDWDWRGIFLFNVPIGVAFTLLAVRFLPSSRPVGGRTDFAGSFLLGGTILGVMLGITRMGDPGTTFLSPSFVLPILAGVACGWVFARRAGRVAHAIIPLRLLRGRVFACLNVLNLMFGACAIGFGSLVPLFAEDRFQLSPLSAGSLLTARALGEIGLAVCASMLIDRTGFRLPMIGGFGLIGGGLLLISLYPPIGGPYGWLAFGAAVAGVGTGLSAPAANNASIELSPDDVGAIVGLRGAARQAGAILGVALISSILARASDNPAVLQRSFLVLGLLFIALLPLVLAVPDRSRAARPDR